MYIVFFFIHRTLVGETVIYQWIERIREELQCGEVPDEAVSNADEAVEEAQMPVEQFVPETSGPQQCLNTKDDCPTIHHGEVIIDRKSSFQGHAAVVLSVTQVKWVDSLLCLFVCLFILRR